jgi:hypothetical protein
MSVHSHLAEDRSTVKTLVCGAMDEKDLLSGEHSLSLDEA